MSLSSSVDFAPSGIYPPSYSSASSSLLSSSSTLRHTSSSLCTPCSSSTTPSSESRSASVSSISLSLVQPTSLSSAQTSPSISPPPASHHVLLMLDIQLAMLEPPPVGVPSSSQVKEKIAEVLDHARTANPPPLIVHVRNNGDTGDPDEPDTPGWQLIFPALPGELVVDKRKNNAFAGTSLTSLIPTDAEIVVVGFQTDYSIRATCSAALTRGNEVLLIKGAHATFDRIEVLHGGGITPAWRIEQEIEAELEEAGVYLMDMKDLPGIFMDR